MVNPAAAGKVRQAEVNWGAVAVAGWWGVCEFGRRRSTGTLNRETNRRGNARQPRARRNPTGNGRRWEGRLPQSRERAMSIRNQARQRPTRKVRE